MDVETKSASLDTMAVTIQALHVSGKQMTLAVFRQLPIAFAYEHDGHLNDELEHWGLVRYGIKDDGSRWLVASRDKKLFRCNVDYDKWWPSVQLANEELAKAKQHILWLAAHKYPVPLDMKRWDRDLGSFVNKTQGELEDAVHTSERILREAITAARSQSLLLNLPQLFIAV